MSAPESGSAVSSADPLGIEKCAETVGAGLIFGSSEEEVLTNIMWTALVDSPSNDGGSVPTSWFP